MANGLWSGQSVSEQMARALSRMVAEDGSGLSPGSAVACVEVLAVSGVGVRMAAGRTTGALDGGGEPVWSSGVLVGPLEDLELTLGEGPGVDAASGVLTLAANLVTEKRWPIYSPAATELGAAAVFAVPLRIGAIHAGVLAAYRIVPGPLTDQQLVDLRVFAEAIALLLLDLSASDGEVVPRLAAGPSHIVRAQVHQATGMISVQLGITLAEALIRMRAFAFGNERAIDEVAADVVTRRLRFDSQR